MIQSIRRRLFPHWTDLFPEILAAAKNKPTLHLGSGTTPIEGAVTVDLNPELMPSIVTNLDNQPWPIADDTFEVVVAISILEHLGDFIGAMQEIHRVCRSGAQVHILVPHFSSGASFVDPTHKKHLSARSCDYFIADTNLEREYGFYVQFRYRQIIRRVQLASGLEFLPGATWIANNRTRFWEDYLCFGIRGAGVFWTLEVLKS